MAEGGEFTTVEVRLRDGETIKARVVERPDLKTLHRTLQESEFSRIGDDTIVRSADVRSIQLRVRRGEGHSRPANPPSRPRVMRPAETRAFFLTSEFVLAFFAWLALLLTSLATDSVDAWTFSLLTIAIAAGYMLSRGFAKAGMPSEAWDPREIQRKG